MLRINPATISSDLKFPKTHSTKSTMNTPWSFGICHKTVGKNHNSVCCNVCNQWVHISGNNIPITQNYRKMKHRGTVKNA